MAIFRKLSRALQYVAALVCLSSLAGCGGGGGQGNSTSSGGFTLSTTNVSVSAKRLGLKPLTPNIFVHLTDLGAAELEAGYATGVTPPNWLSVDIIGSGSDYTLILDIGNTTLPIGNYTTTLTVGTADGSGNILHTQNVQISYTLLNGLSITSAPPTAAAIAGSSNSQQTLAFTVANPANVQWSAASNAAWLVAPAGANQGAGNFNMTVNTSGLQSGTYRGALTITNSTDSTDTATISVVANITAATLTVSSSSILIGGASGLDVTAAPLSISLNTMQGSFPWTITTSTTSGGNWLHASSTSGTVSANSVTVNIDADRTQLSTGIYAGQIQVQANVNGETISASVPVTLNFDNNRLLASPIGVAFSKFPSRQVTTRNISVNNTWGVSNVAWHAVSDQSWLSVTSDGVTGAPLTLAANATGLTPGQYFANVVISSTDPSIANQETVRVGFTVSNTDPVALTDISGIGRPIIVASPVEPLIFVVDSASGTFVNVYDVNTGALLRTLSGLTNATELAISGDGQTLFVRESDATGGIIQALNPVSGAVLATYSVGTVAVPDLIEYARPDAHAVLLSPITQEAFDLVTGNRISIPVNPFAPTGMVGPIVAVSPDQRTVYTANSGDPAEIAAYSMRFSTIPSVGLLIANIAHNDGYNDNRGNTQDLAVSPDGQQIYVASGAPYRFDILDASTLALTGSFVGDFYPTNVESCWNGLFAGGVNNISDPGDIWLYGAGNASRGTLDSGTTSLVARTVRFSADCLQLVSGNDTSIRIQTAPAP